MSNHEQSKKHKENAAYLKLVMQQDEAEESGRESEGVVKDDQSEPINSTALDSISSLDEVEVDECHVRNDSKQVPVATTSLCGHSDLADRDGEGDEAVDDATENLHRDDELVDFGAFGKRDRAVCSFMAGNELEDNLVSVRVCKRGCVHACVCMCVHACRVCDVCVHVYMCGCVCACMHAGCVACVCMCLCIQKCCSLHVDHCPGQSRGIEF